MIAGRGGQPGVVTAEVVDPDNGMKPCALPPMVLGLSRQGVPVHGGPIVGISLELLFGKMRLYFSFSTRGCCAYSL